MFLRSKFLAILGTLICAGLLHSQQANFSISIDTPEKTVKVGSTLKINIVRKNTSGHEIVASRPKGGWELGGFIVDVRHGSNQPVPFTKYHKIVRGMDTGESRRALTRKDRERELREELISGGTITGSLGPGEVQKGEIDVSKLYDLSKPGKYTIQVQHTDPQTRQTVKSNSLSVTLSP